LLNRYNPVSIPGLPRFTAALLASWDMKMVHYFEKLPPSPPDDLNLDEAVFCHRDSMMIFDNVRHTNQSGCLRLYRGYRFTGRELCGVMQKDRSDDRNDCRGGIS